MSFRQALLFLMPARAYRHHAGIALARELPTGRAAVVWSDACARHAALVPLRKRYGLGLGRLMRYMEWAAALYGAMRAQGMDRAKAGAIIESVQWASIGPAVALPYRLSRLHSSAPLLRVRWMTDLLFALVFTRPFVRHRHGSDTHVAFDVTVCPLAQYFRDVGFSELTRHAACSLDQHLARQWGVHLQRTKTLADGHDLCDFRFVARERHS